MVKSKLHTSLGTNILTVGKSSRPNIGEVSCEGTMCRRSLQVSSLAGTNQSWLVLAYLTGCVQFKAHLHRLAIYDGNTRYRISGLQNTCSFTVSLWVVGGVFRGGGGGLKIHLIYYSDANRGTG